MKWLNRFNQVSLPVPTNRLSRYQDRPLNAVVALGGGGARGLAHLGVLEVLERSPLRMSRIVGVSIGSLVAACYAVHGDLQRTKAATLRLLGSPDFQHTQKRLLGAGARTGEEADNYLSLYQRFRRLVSNHRRLTRAATSPGLLDSTSLARVIEQLIPDVDVRDTPMPVSIVAADLLSGHQVVIESGSLRQAVLGSMSIPGVFPPVRLGKALLCDLGVLHSLPTEIARSYPHDVAVGVDVGVSHAPAAGCNTALEVMMRMEEVGERLLRRHSLDAADVLIRPDVGWCTWFDFSQPARLIEAGHDAARRSLATELTRQDRTPA